MIGLAIIYIFEEDFELYFREIDTEIRGSSRSNRNFIPRLDLTRPTIVIIEMVKISN